MRHLDLGCGTIPRNPYNRSEVFGVDIAITESGAATIKNANLAIDAIPFEDSFFDSVSAYDFLEHIPRVLSTADGTSTRLPFIELMNEIWRVLAPGGLFYASTPVFPHEATFRDPTHVNCITSRTHEYFVRPNRKAKIYGFIGDFVKVRAQLARPTEKTLYIVPPQRFMEKVNYALDRRRGNLSHVIWEFEAKKGDS